MAVTKEKKIEILEKLKENFKNSNSIAFTSNSGLTVEEISELRTELREVGAKFMLAKKTLIKIALKEVYDIELSDDQLK
jgi:large subunit ribosomal protein L10